MKCTKEVTVILLFLLFVTVTIHGTLRAYATIVDPISGEQTWTYSPYNLENFTIIVLPDTQYYSKDNPEIFDNQTQWIVDNIESMNIVFVTHLGDVVDDWDDIKQWENANHSMSKLDGNVPWGVLAGNHDGIGSDQTNFQNYFGYERFENESWYGGAYQNNNKNNYQLFSAGEDDYLILHLQYNANDALLAWASSIIDTYPTRRVIVSTHEYVDGHWPWNDWRSPIGERIWQNLVKPHSDQIFLVLCGHVDVEAHKTATVDEHAVYELVSDYQEQSNGGNGWLKILEFSPLREKIFVKTYSPYLDTYHPNADSQFTLDYEMTFQQVNITVLSNSTLSDFAFDRSYNQISFNISGEVGTAGYSNVSIPKDLLLGNYLSLRINEELQSYAYYQNETHTSLYFKYTHQGVLQVIINGNGVIPEFDPVIILPLFVTATLIAIIFSKRRLRAYRSN